MAGKILLERKFDPLLPGLVHSRESQNMRRDFKNSLGSRIHDECIEILSLIADANQMPGKHSKARKGAAA